MPWATTPRFLARFGLRSLRNLPDAGLLLPVEAGRAGGGTCAGHGRRRS